MHDESQLLKTEDGSFTVKDGPSGVLFHSSRGARSESQHVFIDAGLKLACERFKEPIRILEIGFGTGLNAQMSWEYALAHDAEVEYVALEPRPLPASILMDISKSGFSDDRSAAFFAKIHQIPPHISLALHPKFKFCIHHQRAEHFDWSQYEAESHRFHLIYHDAFSPSNQPELWTLELIQNLASCMKDGAIWVSYSASGQVRRNLQEAGLEIERLQGALGKREMLRAQKPSQSESN
jgi:tRNA U34 5-methylaminomethyl-2-thiouridine-forming methyltransferase MnmC